MNLLDLFLNISIIICLGVLVFILFYKSKPTIEENFQIVETKYSIQPTIYEISLEALYSNNKKLLCNIIPILKENACMEDGIPIKKEKFPVHLFKGPDSIIYAVFNDGAIYRKNSMTTGIWNGPLDNSMPNNSRTPLRMITLSPNGNEYLGVGFDNRLYIKRANEAGFLDITTPWELVSNNNNIIYVITNPSNNRLIGVNKEGQLLIKETEDITSDFILLPRLSVSVLKLFFDNSGYMLVLDDKFNLWQMADKDWQNSDIDFKKGSNPTRINDILYDNDGKLYGIVFPLNPTKLQLMKQNTFYFLSVFLPLLNNSKTSDDINFVMNDNSILLAKSGVDFSKVENIDDSLDNDIQQAKIRNDLENKRKLREFCALKKKDYDPRKMENYELLEDIDNNNKKIADLNTVLQKLKQY
jgi:hypothetical protein